MYEYQRDCLIANVREKCRFYAADIYSWLRVAMDFAMSKEEGLGCVVDDDTDFAIKDPFAKSINSDRTKIAIEGRSVTVQSCVAQRSRQKFYFNALHGGCGMYYTEFMDRFTDLIHPREVLLSIFSEELIVRIVDCGQKQTIVAARGKVISDTIKKTAAPDSVYLKATFDAAIYGDTPFDPLSAARILCCFYQ